MDATPDLELICIPPNRVEKLWPHFSKWIATALLRSHSDYSLDYVRRRLLQRKALLWVACDRKSGRAYGAGTTEINRMIGTERRVCVITTWGGENFGQVDKFLQRIEQYAREERCDLVRFYGRHGWARTLSGRGYEQPWIALEKKVG